MRAARHLRPLPTATLTGPRTRAVRRGLHGLGHRLHRAPHRVHCGGEPDSRTWGRDRPWLVGVEIARRSA